MQHKPLPPAVERARQQGWLRAIDVALVQFLQQQDDSADDSALAAAALVSQQLSLGHICLDLDRLFTEQGECAQRMMGETPKHTSAAPHTNLASELYQLGWPALKAALQASQFVGEKNDDKPLVLDESRLYLHSQWRTEHRVAQHLASRIKNALKPPQTPATRSKILDALFPSSPNSEAATNWQKIACANALRGHFSVITGGPGTGKTTTVVKVLCALLAQQSDQTLHIYLAAPTGKAAARMQESMNHALESHAIDPKLFDGQLDNWREQLQVKAKTIHRLLGVIPSSREFRHNERHPLRCDVVIVDEASMIALDQMDSLLRALPESTHLVLLGDKDQLASVEAGAVMGDLCQGADDIDYQPQHAEWLSRVSGETLKASAINPQGHDRLQCITLLQHSHRFDANSGIGQLAEAINGGHQNDIDPLFQRHSDIGLVALTQWRSLCRLGNAELDATGYAHYLQQLQQQRPAADAAPADFDQWALTLLKARNRFQLLCALRRGEWGVEAINQAIEADLQRQHLLPRDDEQQPKAVWYEGRPIMIQKNDYPVGLMNGDTGLVLSKPDANGDNRLYAVFPDADQGVRWIAPSRLSHVETAFAMTVHKSQGSEFEHTALLLPPEDSPVLSRELVYTAVTRAKAQFSLCCADTQLLKQLSQRPTMRSSGLQRQLENFLYE
ncbi:exodeoxyribonuclease V, alpha subunit [gamma proteobacterium HTCC5015]|nr:exodeoxyribonuclease V, alpha subunit [gamma proteobacterium HTCC5015]